MMYPARAVVAQVSTMQVGSSDVTSMSSVGACSGAANAWVRGSRISAQSFSTAQYVLPGATITSIGGKTIMSFSRKWNTGQAKDGIIAQTGMTSFNWALGAQAKFGDHNGNSGGGIASASFRPGVARALVGRSCLYC